MQTTNYTQEHKGQIRWFWGNSLKKRKPRRTCTKMMEREKYGGKKGTAQRNTSVKHGGRNKLRVFLDGMTAD